jgi:hypothetical protein
LTDATWAPDGLPLSPDAYQKLPTSSVNVEVVPSV